MKTRYGSASTCHQNSTMRYPCQKTGVFMFFLKDIRCGLCCSHAHVFPAYAIRWPSIDVDIPATSSEKFILSIDLMTLHNSVGKRTTNPQIMPRHHCERESPQSVMVAIKVHMKSGKERFVDMLETWDIHMSYHRLCQLSTDISNSVICSLWAGGCCISFSGHQRTLHNRWYWQQRLQTFIYYCCIPICTAWYWH